MNPLLEDRLRAFIATRVLDEGIHTIGGRRIVRATHAKFEHRVAFRRADDADWLVYAWGYNMSGEIVGLGPRPDLTEHGMDDEDAGELAIWLLLLGDDE